MFLQAKKDNGNERERDEWNMENIENGQSDKGILFGKYCNIQGQVNNYFLK